MAMAWRGAGGQQHLEDADTGAAEEKTQTQGPLKREGAGMSDVEQGEAGGRDRVWGERGRELAMTRKGGKRRR
jgi:hypothetical protein